VQGSAARAAVLGSGDGLLTNISLVLGVAGASTNGGAVRIAGVAGMLAGAFSMAAGELVSVKAHDELVQHEIDVERAELADDPAGEQRELAAMYRARGVAAKDADTVARILMATPEVALDTHVRLELGVDPDSAGSSRQAAVVSFFGFSLAVVLHRRPDRGPHLDRHRSISRGGPRSRHRLLLGPGRLAHGGPAVAGRDDCRFGHLRRGPPARTGRQRGVSSAAVTDGLPGRTRALGAIGQERPARFT
jgi:hypothetical protein